MKDCCNTKNSIHTRAKVIEDAGALRSRLRNLISLLPKEDYWQTEAHKRKANHSFTFHSFINIQAGLWHWKPGHSLETLTQHSTSNPKHTELEGENGGETETGGGSWLTRYLSEREGYNYLASV